MKKSFIALAFLLVFGGIAMAQQMTGPQHDLKNVMKWHRGERWIEVYRPTSVVVEGDVLNRYLYTYDEDFYMSVLEEQVSDGNNGWTTTFVTSYEYDYNGNPIEILTKNEQTGEEYSLETYTYSNGELSEMIRQIWNNGEWINDVKEVYNYTDLSYTVLYWMWNGSNWSPSWLHTYTYNEDNIDVLVQYMEGGAWQNSTHSIIYFNEEGAIAEILYEIWNNNAWESDLKMSYHYTNGLYDLTYLEQWSNKGWTEIAKAEYSYDSHGNAVSGEYFCKSSEGWTSCVGTLLMAYDDYYDILEFDGSRVQATYLDVTDVEEQPEVDHFTFYPNPVKDVLMIKSENFKKAEIYSLTGVKVMETTANKVDVSNLRSGTYLLKVVDLNGGNNTRVFVKK